MESSTPPSPNTKFQ